MSDMYLFTVLLIGYGENEDEAWDDACEGFELEHGKWSEVEKNPDEYVSTEIEITDEITIVR